MFKWIKKKILEKIVKDIISEVPTLKEKAKKLWENNKDEILEKIKTAIKEAITKAL